jgi:hypothetical protein
MTSPLIQQAPGEAGKRGAGPGAVVPGSKRTPETAVTALYRGLTEAQRKVICFDWDHRDARRGLLRTHVSNSWRITPPVILGRFYTRQQRALLFEIFKGVFNPDWHYRLLKQLKDDHDGMPWGADLSCALFGAPGTGKFQFVMTGRHLTIRVDGERDAHVVLGGPIFHGHAPSGHCEWVNHPGNIFWHQAQLASKVYTILDGKQQRQAVVAPRPREQEVGFRGRDGPYPGLPCAEMTPDQQEGVQKVLLSLIEPYRKQDQEEVLACLARQGGLQRCALAFYQDGGVDGSVWESWRLEGPSFVWYFRGCPHVHIWINVGDDSSVPINSQNDGFEQGRCPHRGVL